MHDSKIDPVAERFLAEARERKARLLTRSERVTYWTASIGFVAAALTLLALAHRGRSPHTWVELLLLTSYALASRLEFEIGSTLAIPTELVLVEMLFLLPPAQVPLWVAAGGVLGQLPEYMLRVVPAERALIRVTSSWFAFGPALVFELFRSPQPTTSTHVIAVLGIALAAQFAADLASSTAREWAALRVPPRQLVSQLALVFSIDLMLAPLGLLAAIAARHEQAALLLPLPLLFVIGLSTQERRQRLDHALELSNAYRGTALLLGDVVEADDEYTGAHSRDVLQLVLAVCDELGVEARDRLDAEFAALLHDVGKIRIPSQIIGNPGPLTPEERAIVSTHTIEGQRLLEQVGGRLAEVGAIIRSCHERWDGRGYPDRLAGEETPLVARIVACCDAFSAMTTNRPYRRARTIEAALAELQENAGSQFDPVVAMTLVRLVRSGRAGLERRPELVAVAGTAG